MNTASTTSSLPRPGPFTKGEIEIHREFARKCVRAKQFEDLSSRYMAMKAECHRRGLRACSFQEFRNAIRLNRLDAVRRRNLVKAWPAATEYYFGPPPRARFSTSTAAFLASGAAGDPGKEDEHHGQDHRPAYPQARIH